MKNFLSNNTRLKAPLMMITLLSFFLCINGCSNNAKNSTQTKQTLNTQQKVEFGKVVAVRMVQLKPDHNHSNNHILSNVGVAASSGGFRGIYGSVDLATLGRLFNNNSKTNTAQEIIVKKTTGETVSITQPFKENFKQGDNVKILIRNGYAQVVH